MAIYNPDGSINGEAPDDLPGAYNRNGTIKIAVSVPTPDLTAYARKTDIPSVPAPSDVMPPAADLNGSTGTSPKYALADHTHAVKLQRTILTTDAAGNATWNFAKPFIKPPSITGLPNTTGNPIALSITNKTTTSVTIQAKQSRALPSTIALLSALFNYSIFSDPAANVQIDVFAGEVTQ